MIVAGIDIGNATTEVVLVEGGVGGPTVRAAQRVPTRRAKGSLESLLAAAALLRRMERQGGLTVSAAAVPPLRAVETATVNVAERAVATGRLRLIGAGAPTPGGRGAGVGRLCRLGSEAGVDTPLVVLVPGTIPYAAAAAEINAMVARGCDVRAAVLAGDEAVLVANRLARPIPVVDQVDPTGIDGVETVAVEVAGPGQPLRLLTDPVALAAALGLPPAESGDVAAVSHQLFDRSNAVVAVGSRRPVRPFAEPAAWLEVDGRRCQMDPALIAAVTAGPVGGVSGLALPGRDYWRVDDLFALDLGAVADTATARYGTLSSRAYLMAALNAGDGAVDGAGLLAEELGRPVSGDLTERAAARAGALTTPGARPDALVVDLGAGTIDAIGPSGEVVAAGGGELLTQAVAGVLGINRSSADWVKRGPSVRIEGGGRYEAEDGTRGFLERPAPASTTGMLAVAGPAGLLAFERRHAPSEWRALRLRLKEAVFGANLRRVFSTVNWGYSQVLVVGGPADDDEMLGVLARAAGTSATTGRATVGATLAGGSVISGHRYAAALGLALQALEEHQ